MLIKLAIFTNGIVGCKCSLNETDRVLLEHQNASMSQPSNSTSTNKSQGNKVVCGLSTRR